MDLEYDPHAVNFTRAWIGGFTLHHKNMPVTASLFIEGRDILISAAMLSIQPIVDMMKWEFTKMVDTL
jgi:hypothetical protein